MSCAYLLADVITTEIVGSPSWGWLFGGWVAVGIVPLHPLGIQLPVRGVAPAVRGIDGFHLTASTYVVVSLTLRWCCVGAVKQVEEV